jgi:SAM-dependent methyltransferase
MTEIAYIGNELEVFEHAIAWKNYYGRFFAPYLKGKVLEVGAGIGGTTTELCDGSQEKWVCLEPDPQLYASLQEKITSGRLPKCCSAFKATTGDLSPSEKFDAIMYIDVIEHIEKDAEELARATTLLADGGYLIVLVPAHQYLYNEFDKAIGHYRRYDRKMLKAAAPGNVEEVKMRYLDSVGLMASLVNKWFLKQTAPTIKQIHFWNGTIIPVSKITDVLLNYNAGKTLTAIWKKK